MDQELRTFLEAMEQRLSSRMDDLHQKAIAHADEVGRRLDTRMTDFENQVAARFEELRRHMGVLFEDTHSRIRALGEYSPLEGRVARLERHVFPDGIPQD